MAAVINKRGLMPIDTPYCGIRRTKYRLQPGSTKIFLQDPCIKHADGTVTIGAATGVLLGSIMELFDEDGVSQSFYPGDSSAGWIAIVADDPNQRFMVAEDDGTGIITDIGAGANLVIGTGVEMTGMSGWLMDSTSMGGTAGTEQLMVIDFVDMIENDIGNTNALWYVMINLHQLASGATPV